MKKICVLGVTFAFAHCMAVQVPEDYVSDVYYGKPKVVAVSASTSASLSSVPVQVKFGSPMNASSVTVNILDTSCTGTIQISALADNFATNTCLQFVSASSESRDSVFTAILSADIDPNSDYLVKVLNTATDFLGNTLGADTILSFKSGVPPGQEPTANISVVPKKVGPPADYTITFSRQMTYASISAAAAKDCNDSDALFVLMDNTTQTCVNVGDHNPKIVSTAYTLSYNGLTANHNFTLTIRAGLIDRFGIATIAPQSTTNTLN